MPLVPFTFGLRVMLTLSHYSNGDFGYSKCVEAMHL